MDIKICTGRSCKDKFSRYMIQRVERDRDFYSWKQDISCSECLCLGNCKQSPNISLDGSIHSYMNGAKLSGLIQKHLPK